MICNVYFLWIQLSLSLSNYHYQELRGKFDGINNNRIILRILNSCFTINDRNIIPNSSDACNSIYLFKPWVGIYYYLTMINGICHLSLLVNINIISYEELSNGGHQLWLCINFFFLQTSILKLTKLRCYAMK